MQRYFTHKKVLIVLIIAVIIIPTSIYYFSTIQPEKTCVKPRGGYLIIANSQGFNDSKLHGSPFTDWPIITVQKGSEVSITICNEDTQAHGFQISHYLDSQIISVAPGQSLTFTFVADKQGNFTIYCSIFCTSHVFMQNGLLVVK